MMPFKLKLKKSRHYSVVSKSLFVISVEILDGTNVECTLSSESTGQDCLDVVCQKLGLNQPKFFGLQYVSCNSENNLCWLELDRPIKRQLDKYAKALSVYLRVMYYVISGARLITDEVTRYHYFLQLKQNVIEERGVSCTPQQAIQLASYSMQAEFGNFDSERHTGHYLKDFQLFPKTYTDPALLESLTEAASRQHAALHNLPQGTAEEYYICACQKVEGYGEEEFNVKDKAGNEAILGIGLTGVSVTYAERGLRRYRWSDISNVINHKKEFTVESVGGSEKAEFLFGDVESAKRAWRFCVLQHIFFRQYEANSEPEAPDKTVEPPPIFQQSSEDRICQMESYEDVTNAANWEGPLSSTRSLFQRAQSTSCLDLNQSNNLEHLRSLLPSYRPAPDYETAVEQKYRSSSSALIPSKPMNSHGILYSSQPEIHQSEAYSAHLPYPDVTHNNIEQSNVVYSSGLTQSQSLANENRHVDFDNVGIVHLYKQPPPYPSNRMNSNSTPDLAGISQQAKLNNTFINNLVSGSSPDLVSGNNLYLKHYYQTQGTHPIHRSHSYLPPQHGTYENITSIFNSNMLGRPQQAVIVENPNITKHIKKVYDEHGNIIYCMPANMKQILHENQLPSTGFVVTRNQNAVVALDQSANPSEPIYENIPLPWQNEYQIRSRTQSINSAPEISQVVNHSVVNALHSQLQQMTIGNPEENTPENLYFKINHSEENVLQSKLGSPNASDVVGATSSQMGLYIEPPRPRTNTFTVKIDAPPNNLNNTTNSYSGSNTTVSTTEENSVDATSLSNSSASAGKTKKKRWGILIGRSKIDEKIKSATLGREKKKSDKEQSNNRHRWSTGLPKFNTLPPSISKEAMVTVGSKQRFYIAAQGPTRTTLPYFWQCVWEAEVYLMIQLTDSSEDLTYLPDADERCININQDYQVWWEFSQKTGQCVTSKIRLCHVSSRRYRTIWHLHYTDWGDQGCPNSVAHFLGFLEELQSVHQHSMEEIPPGHNKNPPILVHCTAGVGRTGLTILSDLLLYTVDHNQEVCIPGVVTLLRQQRAFMIQTIAQYRFVYSLLIHYLKQTRLI